MLFANIFQNLTILRLGFLLLTLSPGLCLAVEFDHIFTKGDFNLQSTSHTDRKTTAQPGARFKIVESDDTGITIQFEESSPENPSLYFVPSIYSLSYKHDPEKKLNPEKTSAAYFSVSNPDAVPAFYKLLQPGEPEPPPVHLQYGERVRIVSIEDDSYHLDHQGNRYIAYYSEATPESWLEDSDSFAKNNEILDLNKSLSKAGQDFVWKTDDIPPGIDIEIKKGDILVRQDPQKDEWGYIFHLKSDPSKKIQLSRRFAGEFVEVHDGQPLAPNNTAPAAPPSPATPPAPTVPPPANPETTHVQAPNKEAPSDDSQSLVGLSRDDRYLKVLAYYDHIKSIIPENYMKEAERVCSSGGCSPKTPGKCMNSGIYNELMAWLRTRLLLKSSNPLFPWGASGVFSLMMTAYGEARNMTDQTRPSIHDPMTRANMLSVMRVIQNRSKKAGERATLMKIATQDRQFTMWNRTDANFACMISGKDRTSVQRAASAYVDFIGNEVKYSNGLENKEVYHYHTNTISPDWSNSKKRLSEPKVFVPPPPPNGTSISLASTNKDGVNHRFYKNIRWTYADKHFGK